MSSIYLPLSWLIEMTNDKFSPTRRSVLRLGAMSALGIGIGIPAVSGSVAATSCPRTPGYWANHPEAWKVEYPYTINGYEFTPDNLLDPSKGDKTLIMAKHLLATILNFQNRKSENDPCVDEPVKGSEYNVRDMKRKAEQWLESATPGQKSWYAGEMDGEPIKNVLDAFNNNPQKLGLEGCPCYGDD